MGIKDALFQLFLFFYFSQILGLSGTYTGLATIIALFFDAITDPWVGTLSDRWESKNLAEDTLYVSSGFAAWPFTLFTIYTPCWLS